MSIFKHTFTYGTDAEILKAERFNHSNSRFYDAVRLRLAQGSTILCKTHESYLTALSKYAEVIVEMTPERVLLDVIDHE